MKNYKNKRNSRTSNQNSMKPLPFDSAHRDGSNELYIISIQSLVTEIGVIKHLFLYLFLDQQSDWLGNCS